MIKGIIEPNQDKEVVAVVVVDMSRLRVLDPRGMLTGSGLMEIANKAKTVNAVVTFSNALL